MMRYIAPILALCALSACNSQREDAPVDDAPDAAQPSPDAPVSILRPEIEQPELPEIPLEPLLVTIGFPEGGDTLDAAATAALEQTLASDQVKAGGPIILRAHSDAGGDDAANLRASQARGDKVRDWLIDKGVAETRIAVIAFGEQNPVRANALPDGSPSEAGREANRRVDIEVAVIAVNAPQVDEASLEGPSEPVNED